MSNNVSQNYRQNEIWRRRFETQLPIDDFCFKETRLRRYVGSSNSRTGGVMRRWHKL